MGRPRTKGLSGEGSNALMRAVILHLVRVLVAMPGVYRMRIKQRRRLHNRHRRLVPIMYSATYRDVVLGSSRIMRRLPYFVSSTLSVPMKRRLHVVLQVDFAPRNCTTG